MLFLLLIAILVFWGSFLFKSYKTIKKELDIVNSRISYQNLWLDTEPQVKHRLKSALTLMDPKETYSRGEFIARLDSLSRTTNVPSDITNLSSKTDDVFDEHSLVVNFRDASIKNLIDFDAAIASEAPYLKVTSLELAPTPRNPLVLRAKFEVTAIELKNFKGLDTHHDEK